VAAAKDEDVERRSVKVVRRCRMLSKERGWRFQSEWYMACCEWLRRTLVGGLLTAREQDGDTEREREKSRW
jgi:hypothetical protein